MVVNRVTSPLNTSTVTYSTQPSFSATTSEIDVTTSDLYTAVQIDVTSTVNQWLDGTFENNGFALTNSDGTSVVQFATNIIQYEPYFPKLIITYSSTPVGPAGLYAYIYNTGTQSIAEEASIPFSSNGALLGISHTVNTGEITLESAATYAVWYTVTGQTANQFALFQNDIVVPGSIYGTDSLSSGHPGMAVINAAVGDLITVRNYSSGASIVLDNSAGGSQTNVSASIMILKIGPSTSPNPALTAVNEAQDTNEMRAAIEDPLLGLDLTAFNALDTPQQDEVLGELLANRPSLGYPTISSVQDALNAAVNQVVDPNNIYVKAGSAGGNGSIANPFGTIQQGINAVAIGGTVNVLSGNYPITSQINVNKTGMILSGEAGVILELQADIIAILITGAGATVSGLTITSDIPYEKEFIQIGAANVIVVNNVIYGSVQPPPMSDWVVNRAVVPQVGTSNVLVTSNNFNSLRTGMYINPNTTGQIENNVVYNTKGGFLVEGAFTTFEGNSWGTPPNEFDIVLLAGTTMGPPYDDIPALQAANDNATISDQR